MGVNIFGLPQDLVLRPILFNISRSDLFFILYDIDIPCYTDGNILCKIVGFFRMSSKKLFKWFKDHQMEGNTDKRHLILSTGD